MPLKKFLKAAQDLKNKSQMGENSFKPPANHDESNWLVSYADMMTLLCGFFIMLFSMAKMDEPQYERVKEAMSKQFGGDYHSDAKEMAKFVTEVIQEAGVEAQTTVKSEGTGVTVAFQSTLFFDTLSADVKPAGFEILTKIAHDLFEREKLEGKQYQIVVEGHTDSRPITAGTFATNWELSAARATRVIRFFLDQHFPSDHLTAIGYGDTRPDVAARLPDGTLDDDLLSKNQRVVLRILSPNADSIPLPQPRREVASVPAPAPAAAAAVPPAPQKPATPAH